MKGGNYMILKPQKREQIFPLPVVFISTLDQNGIANIGAWSNITPICKPLDKVVFASLLNRDTLSNVRSTKEFVVSIPTCDMLEEVMITSKNFPPEVDEFKKADLMTHPSSKVKVPGVDGCIAWAECTLVEEILRKNYSLIIGKVVSLEVNDDYYNASGTMDIERARPLTVMLGNKSMQYTTPVKYGRCAEYSEMFIKNRFNPK